MLRMKQLKKKTVKQIMFTRRKQTVPLVGYRPVLPQRRHLKEKTKGRGSWWNKTAVPPLPDTTLTYCCRGS